MAKVLFAGGKMDSFSISGSVFDSTTSGRFDSSYADSAFAGNDTSSYGIGEFSDTSDAAVDVVTGETLYVHDDMYFASGGTTANINEIELRDSSGYPWLAIRSNDSGNGNKFGLYYNSNTGASPTWTQIGSTQTVTANARTEVDIVLTLGSPHTVSLYLAGSLAIGPTTFTQASLTSLRSIKCGFCTASSFSTHSQVLATEGISTLGAKVKYSRPTAAGTYSQWTGSYTDVNEAATNDATTIQSGTAGQKSSFAMGDVTVPAGMVIKAVFHFMRAKNDGGAPANIKSLCISGATEVSSSNISGVGISFAPARKRYDTDPNTSAQWTQSGFNAAEFGAVSAT